jgi:hypothetical protein
MMLRRWIACCLILIAPLSWADWAADRDASAGYVTVTTLATAVDEAVPFVVVYLSDLPADFHTAMDAASDTDGKTIRVSNSDGTTQLACVPIGVNTATDTGCLIFLGTGMSASVDVDYRIYVGNASLSMPTASGGMGEQAVFASYAGVYFPGVSTRDWTAGGRTLTAVNSPGTAASGLEGITAATYATNKYHHNTSATAVTNWPVTIEAMADTSSSTLTGTVAALGSTASNFPVAGIAFGGASSDGARTDFRGDSGSNSNAEAVTYSTSTLYYVAATRDANTGTSRAYLNTTTASNTTTITTPTFNNFAIGGWLRTSLIQPLSGSVAVALLSSSVRSANYVSTMQDNWAGTMYSVGAWTALDSGCTTGSTGWVLFQTATTTSASGTLVDWTNTSNAIVDDANYASATLDPVGNYESEYLNLTNIDYGTTVPTSADSYTVTVRIKRARATGGGDDISDLTVQFIDETGTRIGDNVADTLTNWPTTAASVDYTITGHTFDGSEFDADSGLAIRATGIDSATDCDARVLVAWIKIDWNCGDDAAKARGFFALTE